MTSDRPTRREIIGVSLGASAFAALVPPHEALAQGATLPATPACGEDHDPTPRQSEGPYYKPSTPRREDFRSDGPGEGMDLIGFVLTRDCKPVARALVDLWHCDAAGVYDNTGFRFRGHVFTDDAGRYRFTTVVPGLYPGRTRHFHVKVQPPGGRVLTTQLYFPNEPGNARDWIFDKALVVKMGGGSRVGRFDFVVA